MPRSCFQMHSQRKPLLFTKNNVILLLQLHNQTLSSPSLIYNYLKKNLFQSTSHPLTTTHTRPLQLHSSLHSPQHHFIAHRMVMPSLCSRRQASCSPQTQAHSARTPNCFRKQESMPHQKLELSSPPQMLDSTPRTVGWSCFQTQGPTAHRKLALWIQTVGSRTLPATVQKTGTRTDSAEVEWNRIRQTVRQAFVDQTPLHTQTRRYSRLSRTTLLFLAPRPMTYKPPPCQPVHAMLMPWNTTILVSRSQMRPSQTHTKQSSETQRLTIPICAPITTAVVESTRTEYYTPLHKTLPAPEPVYIAIDQSRPSPPPTDVVSWSSY